MIIGKNGRHYVGDDRVEGEDPLAPYGPMPPATCAAPPPSATVPISW